MKRSDAAYRLVDYIDSYAIHVRSDYFGHPGSWYQILRFYDKELALKFWKHLKETGELLPYKQEILEEFEVKNNEKN